jgi:hypothetical protein
MAAFQAEKLLERCRCRQTARLQLLDRVVVQQRTRDSCTQKMISGLWSYQNHAGSITRLKRGCKLLPASGLDIQTVEGRLGVEAIPPSRDKDLIVNRDSSGALVVVSNKRDHKINLKLLGKVGQECLLTRYKVEQLNRVQKDIFLIVSTNQDNAAINEGLATISAWS